MLAAPLLAGNDIRTMSDETKEVLLNDEVIAVDQDMLGAQGTKSGQEDSIEIWSRTMADGGKTIGLFNRSDDA